jgi:hypothetical protein
MSSLPIEEGIRPLPEARPAWNPKAEPRKFRCEGGVVHLWAYPDAAGTIEVQCKATSLKRPGCDTRHLYNAETGEHFTIHPPKPE